LEIFIVDNNNSNQAIKPASRIKISLFIFGLIICVRHDLAPLLLPATIYIVLKKYKSISIKQWVVFSIIAFLPFSLYSLFSLTYYGFPFPNTAYAKLNTGIANKELFKQGFIYFYSTFKHDTITILVIIATLVFNSFRSSKKCFKYLAYGVILNLFYVFYVGGDFMQGRFLSYAYMVSVILLLLRFNKVNAPTFLLIFIAICSYLIFYQHTPFNSPVNYLYAKRLEKGVFDVRGLHFHKLSLYQYITRDREAQTFPNTGEAPAGYKFKESSDKIKVFENIGIFGYYSGTEKIIINPLALSDPLLARMPVLGFWSIGHFKRKIPAGYVESIMNGNEVIINPGINKFYKKLKIVTQNESLFTLERLKTILLFNLGVYDHLLLEK
jgi:arabinofuranosyltransferase